MSNEENTNKIEDTNSIIIEEDEDDNSHAFSSNTIFIKKIFFTLTFAILVFIFFMLVIQQVTNLDKYKTQINEEITKIINAETTENNELGSTAAIKGTIKFRSFPFPHITISNIEVANLTFNRYLLDAKIEKATIPVSIFDVIKKDISLSKIKFHNVDVKINEEKEEKGNIIKKILENSSNKKFLKNQIINFSLNNSSIIINGIAYTRELANINTNIKYNQTNNNVEIDGNLLSNRQPLDISILINKSNIKANLSSQAFNFDTEINFINKQNSFTGSSKIKIVNFQVFSRTIFNTSDFLYKRVKDNDGMNVNYDIAYQNKILTFKNINLKGKNIDANGSVEINLESNQKNNINFDIANIDIDKILEKSLSSDIKPSEDDISIFNNGKITTKEQDNFKSFLEGIFKINPTDFNINIKNLKFNNNAINSELNFVYFKDGTIKLKKIIANMPGDSKLNIENINDENILSLKGGDFNKMWNFLENTSNNYNATEVNKAISSNTQDKTQVAQNIEDNSFELNGNIKINGNKVFIDNSNFKYKNINSTNRIEIHFDSGISFIAIETNLDNLIINKKEAKSVESDLFNQPMLKNELLFLNDFALNTFIKFNIKNFQYGDFVGNNYSFITKTEPGIINMYQINLNNQISGNISLNIKNSQPTINASLEVSSIDLANNINLPEIIFNLPSFEDFSGSIKINGKNILFKRSTIQDFTLESNIENGILNVNTNINGFGGKCNITGFLDMQYNRKLNLTFNGCNADLGQTLYLFTNIDNISGLFGFSSILYYEGTNLQKFLDSIIIKSQFIGTGITIDRYNLAELISNLYKINSDYELAKIINADEILNGKSNKTIFEKLSGNLQYSKTSNGTINFDVSREFLNGKAVGTFSFLTNNNIALDLNINFLFLIVTLKNSVPLNLATNIKGETPNSLAFASNLEQINSYINSLRKTIETLNIK